MVAKREQQATRRQRQRNIRLDGSWRVETRGVTASVRESVPSERGRKQNNEPWPISQSAPSVFLSFSRRSAVSVITPRSVSPRGNFRRWDLPFACVSNHAVRQRKRERERERERKEARKMNGKEEKKRQTLGSETFSPGQIGSSVIKIRILIARSIITA